MVKICKTVGGEGGLDVSLSFHLHPHYPSCPPGISVTSTHLSKTECHSIRQKLIDQAAALVPEPMLHQLVECVQVVNHRPINNLGDRHSCVCHTLSLYPDT